MKVDSPKALIKILDRASSRREFVLKSTRGVGYLTLLAQLSACGGSSSDSESSEPDPPDPDPPEPIVPPASAEYTALKRTSFGVTPSSLNEMELLGIDTYLEQQLDHTMIDDGDLEAQIDTRFPLTKQSPAQLYAGFPGNIGDVALQMYGATQYRQIYSERQLYEVMVEFWSNHFNIHLLNGLGPSLKPEDDLLVIREHALGNFGDMLHASAKSPSMLFYLDNFFNQQLAPNENYARELMELHTLGVDGGYTEDDIKEVARCFTGWTIRFPGDPTGDVGTFVFQPSIHDDEPKTVLGAQIFAGGGINDGEDVLDLLASHPSTAQFIATKLCKRFISDTPEQETIDAVADEFTLTNGDIKDTLRALFATNEFQSTSDQKYIRPTEYLASLVRMIAPDGGYPTDSGQLLFFAQSILGQLPHNWPTPDGYPDEQSYWESTGGFLNRWRLSFLTLGSVIEEVDVFGQDISGQIGTANTPSDVTDAVVENILLRPISDADRQLILDWIEESYDVGEDTELTAGLAELFAGLILAALISSAYFQMR